MLGSYHFPIINVHNFKIPLQKKKEEKPLSAMVGSLQTFKKKETILPSAMVGSLHNPGPKRKLKVYELYQPLCYYWMDLVDELFHLFGTNVLF